MFEAENERRQSCRQQRQQCEVGDVSLGRYQFERKLHNSRFSQPTIRRNNTLNIDEPEEPKIDGCTLDTTYTLDIGPIPKTNQFCCKAIIFERMFLKHNICTMFI